MDKVPIEEAIDKPYLWKGKPVKILIGGSPFEECENCSHEEIIISNISISDDLSSYNTRHLYDLEFVCSHCTEMGEETARFYSDRAIHLLLYRKVVYV